MNDVNLEADETTNILNMAQDLVDKAREALQHSKDWTTELEEMSTKMDDGLEKLQTKIDELKLGVNMSTGPVEEAINHATSLEDQAKFLERLDVVRFFFFFFMPLLLKVWYIFIHVIYHLL